MNAPITQQTLQTLIRTQVEPNDTPARQHRNALRAIALSDDYAREAAPLLEYGSPAQRAAILDRPGSPLYPDRAAIRRELGG